MKPGESEALLLERLREGDERAFRQLMDAYESPLLRVAMTYTRTRAIAEEVVQETWLGVIKGLDRFEGRSSLKTWIFRILTNIAMTRGAREARSVPFSALAGPDEEAALLDPDRFLPADHDQWPHHWTLGPTPWPRPEAGLLSGEARLVILDAIEALPSAQRRVISLRDVEGWSSEEVCEALELSDGNQRVLLHRARTKVRSAVEHYFGALEPALA